MIEYIENKRLPKDQVVALYSEVGWSSSKKPDALINALANSHSVISAWDGDSLVGLGNAISDGHLVVYYPHLLVSPQYQGNGIGKTIVSILQNKYSDIHQQILVADGAAVDFYINCGFSEAGSCRPLWIYEGNDHD